MRYLLMIVGDETWMELPPEENMRVLQQHQALEADLRAHHKFHHGGGLVPSAEARTIRRNGAGESVVTDGPFAETKEVMGGYYMIEADSIDEAVAIAERIPSSGAVMIEVRQLFHGT